MQITSEEEQIALSKLVIPLEAPSDEGWVEILSTDPCKEEEEDFNEDALWPY